MAADTENKVDPKGRESSPIGDRIWKTVSNTVRSVGGDERVKELIRNVVGEEIIKAVVQNVVPKDAARYAAKTVDTVKDELVALVGKQVNEFLTRLDLGHELQKILTSLSLEVRAEVRFIPNDKRVVKPEIKTGVSLKWNTPEDGKVDSTTATKKPKRSRKSSTPSPTRGRATKKSSAAISTKSSGSPRRTASKGASSRQKPSAKKQAAQKRSVREKKI